MKNNNDIKYKINSNIINNYIDAINNISKPMYQISTQATDGKLWCISSRERLQNNEMGISRAGKKTFLTC